MDIPWFFDLVFHKGADPPRFERNSPGAEWQAKWDQYKDPEGSNTPHGFLLKKELIRMAFTHVPGNDMFFCLCGEDQDDNSHGNWRSANNTGHCQICGACDDKV